MSASPIAFISYRRSDAPQAAQGLHVQLRARFGPGRIFMDVGAISPGDAWPDRLRHALDKATVLLAVIGPSWLAAADPFGRRRLDQPGDWVRNEILSAIRSGKPIVPLLTGASAELPPEEGLPPELLPLRDSQDLRLRDERWDADVDELVKTLVKSHGFIESGKRVVLPEPEVKIAALSEDELEQTLTTLHGWEPVETMIPGDYPNARQELRKAYRFGSFKKAIEFMHLAVVPINKLQHHPRWENQWRTVTVYLSTWDVGNKVTPLDIELARSLDALYEQMRAPAATA